MLHPSRWLFLTRRKLESEQERILELTRALETQDAKPWDETISSSSRSMELTRCHGSARHRNVLRPLSIGPRTSDPSTHGKRLKVFCQYLEDMIRPLLQVTARKLRSTRAIRFNLGLPACRGNLYRLRLRRDSRTAGRLSSHTWLKRRTALENAKSWFAFLTAADCSFWHPQLTSVLNAFLGCLYSLHIEHPQGQVMIEYAAPRRLLSIAKSEEVI